MKTVKKIIIIVIVSVIVALFFYKLFNNKKQLDSDLQAMVEYSVVIPVQVIKPQVQENSRFIRESGVIRAGNEISVLSETSGKVTYASGEAGEHVSAGQTLLMVEQGVINSQLKLAVLNLKNAKKDLERYKKLAGGDAITEQQLEVAELNYQNALTNHITLKKQLENTTIKSPANGFIAKRFVSTGDNIVPTMPVFSIIENQMVFVAKVAGNDIRHINTGQNVEIGIDIMPDKTFSGQVKSIGVIPNMSGRYEVEINILDYDARLREGQDGYVKFNVNLSETGLTIPRKCIEGSINDAQVYIQQGDSVITRKVKATLLNETEVLVSNGLLPDDKVVLTGQINLEEGTRVKVINH